MHNNVILVVCNTYSIQDRVVKRTKFLSQQPFATHTIHELVSSAVYGFLTALASTIFVIQLSTVSEADYFHTYFNFLSIFKNIFILHFL